MFNILRNKKGFTLIELIIVVVILGILITIAAPRVLDSVKNSRINTAVSNVTMVDKAINRVYAESGDWPADQAALEKVLNQNLSTMKLDPYAKPAAGTTALDLVLTIPNGTVTADFTGKPNFKVIVGSTTTVAYTVKVG